MNVEGFHNNEVMFAAKDEIFSFYNEHPVKRKVKNEHPYPAVNNDKDILPRLDNMEGKVSIPSSVAANYNLIPPSNFEPFPAVLCLLRNEIATLSGEMT